MKVFSHLSIQMEFPDDASEEVRPGTSHEEKDFSYLDYCRTVFRLRQELKNGGLREENTIKTGEDYVDGEY